jgi:hypothetical protein
MSNAKWWLTLSTEGHSQYTLRFDVAFGGGEIGRWLATRIARKVSDQTKGTG